MFIPSSSLITINDSNYQDHLDQEAADGRMKGQKSRNFAKNPVGCYAAAQAFSMPLVPPSEQQSKLDALTASNATGIDMRAIGNYGASIPTRDQGQKGYCWAHSPVSAMLVLRAMMNEPFADLSAYSVACPIKNFRDEGGWNSEAVQYIADHGVATSATWPQQSMSRACVQASAEERLKYRYSDWADLDPNNMMQQMITVLLSGGVMAADFNWWSHSVAVIALLSINPFKVMIMNSWGDSWSQAGLGVLEGNKAVASAATAIWYSSAA